MALVAYSDDSDISSDSEDNREPSKITGSVILKEDKLISTSKPTFIPYTQSANRIDNESDSEKDTVKSDKDEKINIEEGIDSIVDEDEEFVQSSHSENSIVTPASEKPNLFASIPTPKSYDVEVGHGFGLEIQENADVLCDVPTVDTWKVTQEIKRNKNKAQATATSLPESTNSVISSRKTDKNKVKFFVPALSEFAEEDSDEEEKREPEAKKIKPSSTVSGLFSLLPQPKHLNVKSAKRSLVPHILTKQPPVQKPRKPKPVPKNTVSVSAHDSDEEEVINPSDFFFLPDSALDHDAKSGVSPTVKASDVIHRVPVPSEPQTEPVMVPEKSGSYPGAYNSYPQNFPEPQDAEGYIPFDPESSTESQATMDEEAMLRLTGKRRGKGEVINFIDVSADDALLTRHEWMTKTLTEEKPSHSFSKKKEGLPSQKQKQKHQITYLAHQAKERELELKNNWSQNRMTKMQTQAKYGF